MPPRNLPLLTHLSQPHLEPGGIEVTADINALGMLQLRYRITLKDVRLPAPQTPGAADGLWQHTCCEAFVAEAGSAYREFNFSPSGQWACYRFTAYRERDEGFIPGTAPLIEYQLHPDGFELCATLPAALLPARDPLTIGLTAVIEHTDGRMQYWALTHGAAQPDFHLRQSFVLTLNRSTP
ncbi:MAG: hypothetical protein H6R14_2848 [Proteobacteria bacterium]|nr:hypothetical protein [Pseudomonadota bacterium]